MPDGAVADIIDSFHTFFENGDPHLVWDALVLFVPDKSDVFFESFCARDEDDGDERMCVLQAHKTKRQNDFYEFNFRVELAYLDCVDSNRWHDQALAVKSFVGHLWTNCSPVRETQWIERNIKIVSNWQWADWNVPEVMSNWFGLQWHVFHLPSDTDAFNGEEQKKNIISFIHWNDIMGESFTYD